MTAKAKMIVESVGFMLASLVPAETLCDLCDHLVAADDCDDLSDYQVQLAERLLNEILMHRDECHPQNRHLIR